MAPAARNEAEGELIIGTHRKKERKKKEKEEKTKMVPTL